MKKMKTINEMTIEEKIGQLLWIGFQGYEFNDNLKYLIDKYKYNSLLNQIAVFSLFTAPII